MLTGLQRLAYWELICKEEHDYNWLKFCHFEKLIMEYLFLKIRKSWEGWK